MFGKLFFGSSGRLWAAALLLVATLTLPSPLARTEQADQQTYFIETDGDPVIIEGMPQEDMDFDNLHVRVTRFSAINDAQLLLRDGQSVTLTVDSETTDVTAECETVDHLLRRLGVTVPEGDMVVLDVRGETLHITVTTIWEHTWEKSTPTTYTTKRVASPSLTKGKERVAQAGQNGEIVETYADVYRNGVLQRTVFQERADDTAVEEIIEYGTASEYVASGDRIAQVVPNEEGEGGYLVFTSGATMPYTSVDTYNATAYDIHGITATGYPTEVGVVAVDPKVIPYGTRMFIQSKNGSWVYGMAVARDCGGAIKGKIIDLWFPDYETCCKWGRRDITVYFLG